MARTLEAHIVALYTTLTPMEGQTGRIHPIEVGQFHVDHCGVLDDRKYKPKKLGHKGALTLITVDGINQGRANLGIGARALPPARLRRQVLISGVTNAELLSWVKKRVTIHWPDGTELNLTGTENCDPCQTLEDFLGLKGFVKAFMRDEDGNVACQSGIRCSVQHTVPVSVKAGPVTITVHD